MGGGKLPEAINGIRGDFQPRPDKLVDVFGQMLLWGKGLHDFAEGHVFRASTLGKPMFEVQEAVGATMMADTFQRVIQMEGLKQSDKLLFGVLGSCASGDDGDAQEVIITRPKQMIAQGLSIEIAIEQEGFGQAAEKVEQLVIAQGQVETCTEEFVGTNAVDNPERGAAAQDPLYCRPIRFATGVGVSTHCFLYLVDHFYQWRVFPQSTIGERQQTEMAVKIGRKAWVVPEQREFGVVLLWR